MRKLQHINSWTVGSEEESSGSRQEEERARESEVGVRVREIKALEGKILLLEEKSKGIQQFYEAKIAHLRTVLAKQNDSKLELTQELLRLAHESQTQTRALHLLKAKLLEDRLHPAAHPARKHPFNFHPPDNSQEKHPPRSKSKPKFLFCTNQLSAVGSANLSSGSSKSGKLLLKKCRSEEYIESEYFNEGQTRPDRSTPGVRNPEHVRRGYR
jgi:hypothetical protein